MLHHDVACQIYDWDGDGQNEIVVAVKDAVVELDGATGKERRRFAIPPDASDCIVFANLTGGERATDILVKTRYGQIWAFDRGGKLLWTVTSPAGYRTAHQPRPIDIDGDGRDEIVAGYALLNPDGTVRWDLADSGLPLENGHLDCARVFHKGNTPPESRLVLTHCTAGCIEMTDGDGAVVWAVTGHHFQSIDIGKLCPDVPGNQIVVDVASPHEPDNALWVLDDQGNSLGRIVSKDCRIHTLVDWHGNGVESIVLPSARALFDGRGRKIGIFDVPVAEVAPVEHACAKGDMAGSGRSDLILSGNPASDICVFRNEMGKTAGRAVPLGTGVNFTLY